MEKSGISGYGYRIAVLAGDGIGKEVMPEGIRVVEAACRRFGIQMRWERFPWGSDFHAQTGRMMPENGLDLLKTCDAIYLGAVGDPGIPDHISLWGMLIPIRRQFKQYVNLRPIRQYPGMQGPLRDKKPGEIDFYVVRENNEGEYSNVGGTMFGDTEEEVVVQEAVFSRRGVKRVIRYAFDLARRLNRRRVTSATKSNGIVFTMPFWDGIFKEIAREYPDIEADQCHIDALSARFVLQPERLEVVVGSNLFGDILSDLGAAVAGSLGIAASANLNPEGDYPSLFEPVHGSAPDIAGRGIANPVGQILSGAMMLEHLGQPDAARVVEKAVEEVLAAGCCKTPDLGGRGTTEEMGNAIAAAINR